VDKNKNMHSWLCWGTGRKQRQCPIDIRRTPKDICPSNNRPLTLKQTLRIFSHYLQTSDTWACIAVPYTVLKTRRL